MEDKPNKIDIPDSIESYTLTLFWGLTMKQIVLMFIATLLIGFGIFNIVSGNYVMLLVLLTMTALTLLGMVEIKGRNFYRYLMFIFAYYTTKPKVLIYHHYSISGRSRNEQKQLVYEQESNYKLFIIILIAVCTGVILLIATGIHLYHVAH